MNYDPKEHIWHLIWSLRKGNEYTQNLGKLISRIPYHTETRIIPKKNIEGSRYLNSFSFFFLHRETRSDKGHERDSMAIRTPIKVRSNEARKPAIKPAQKKG